MSSFWKGSIKIVSEEYFTPTGILSHLIRLSLKDPTTSIEMRIIQNQMQWIGHLVRMDYQRLPKKLFYDELSKGKRPRSKLRKRFNDVRKNNLKQLEIGVDNWVVIAADRLQWKKQIREGCTAFEERCIGHAVLKCALRT